MGSEMCIRDRGETCQGSSNNGYSGETPFFMGCRHVGEIVLVPSMGASSSTTTTTESDADSCSSSGLIIFADTMQSPAGQGLALNPGQCVDLEFVGVLTYGFQSPHGGPVVLVPSTLKGQVYGVQVAAIPATLVNLDCTLPVSSPASCSAITRTGYGRPGN